MKLTPVDQIPKMNGYHKLQELIEEFTNGDAICPRRSAGRGVHHLHPHQPQAHEKAQHGAGGGLCHPGQTL